MSAPMVAAAEAALPEGTRSMLRENIADACRRPESRCLSPLVAAARLDAESSRKVAGLARRLVLGLRDKRVRSSGVDALMKEFSLSSQEGVALMCLAEALLRVPDRATADRLIRDKISCGDWRAHLGRSRSPFVNAATWGLLVTGRLVATSSEEGLGRALSRLIARGGEPVIRKGMDVAMRLLGEQFVTGRTIEEALERGKACERRGYRYSFDMLGEAAMTDDDALAYLASYERAIHAIGSDSGQRGVVDGNGISVKLSALHPRYVWSQRGRVMAELLPRLTELCRLAKGYSIGLNIDAEEADRLDLSLDLLEALALDEGLAGWDGIGFVVQAYQKRAPFVLDFIIDLARRSGHRIMVRLVKGAYWDSEIKRAQLDGLEDYPVFTRKLYTDVSYLACARKLLDARDVVYPQFATHNAHSLAAVYQMADTGEYRAGDYEFQCLHGMGETLYDQVVGKKNLDRRVRIYAPVGSHQTLLAYLVRRLLENGANTSFVNRIVDESVPVDALIADPVSLADRLKGASHPQIPLPRDIYGPERLNSRGFDLSSEPIRRRLAEAIVDSRARRYDARPLVPDVLPAAPGRPITNPADRAEIVGTVEEADDAITERALDIARSAVCEWSVLAPNERAACLTRAASLMEARAPELIALCVREAGKTWANAVAEIREAVDFLRYYAHQVLGFDNAVQRPIGPVVCISPWNFPLAIFTGQVAAALAAGNPVIAKPAEQTPLVAALATSILHQAGIPAAALQLLPGRGETVGARLVSDARVSGVMFTGSTEVAHIINRTLARRGGETVLIAETGGQNAMIVDSTALAEQVVADVITSSYDSAGQRCSALRVLCLQDDIADKMLHMLEGAVKELRIGATPDVRTDIGPVIDGEARDGLEAYVERMVGRGHRLSRLPLPTACETGTFVAPTLLEIASLAELEREVFGPVLHVVRFASCNLIKLVDDINAMGFGLTLGIHSRIDETISAVLARARVGNIYVNRNIIGAVVGVQPFGGEGLSGTGPKAGGPFYLHRLVRAAPTPQLNHGGSPTPRPAFDELAAWFDRAGRVLVDGGDAGQLLARIDRYRSASPQGISVLLPGPTGEENRLGFVARGAVAGLASSMTDLIHQVVAALACGNRIVLEESSVSRRLLAALPDLPASVVSLTGDPLAVDCAAVLFDGDDRTADALRVRLAERDGPIIALCRPEPDYDLSQLVHERTVSVNTAAAGGNASLMTIGN
ncbi:MAG: trifunctional transcriptional regulator/proline dehydrogenase/L-glutamate gamma-semialdehyde dehydrogenase [Rhodocyclaceae bacterium]|nr:trifunctional transcriptional regulator/proline dehydrogenase/L-glutamate gamma-semialdehyde dehydrogenase [Rhodocyclaceae bacterium]